MASHSEVPLDIVTDESGRQWIVVDDVIVGERIRSATDLKELSDSLAQHGQLQPIIVTPEGVLIDGLHRLEAAKRLGWSRIWAAVLDKNEVEVRVAEIIANLRRRDMTWQEQATGIRRLHEQLMAMDENWSQASTAALLGVVPARVSEAITVAQALDVFPEQMSRMTSMQQALVTARVLATKAQAVAEVKNAPQVGNLVQGDSVEVIKSIPDESFHLILTDPPFGIELHRAQVGRTPTTYDDTEEAYERLLNMAPDLYRVLKPNGWIVWFLGPRWYQATLDRFRQVGFKMDEMPIVWDRSDGPCVSMQPHLFLGKAYDMAVYGAKGTPSLTKFNRPNVFRVPPVPRPELKAERPVELYRQIIELFTIPGQTVADFFVGSGSVLMAAQLTSRAWYGVEIDPIRYAHARQRLGL